MAHLDTLELCRVSVVGNWNAKACTGQTLAEVVHVPDMPTEHTAPAAMRAIADARHSMADGAIRIDVDVWHPRRECWTRAATLRVTTLEGWTHLMASFNAPEAPESVRQVLEALGTEADRYGWNGADVRAVAARLLTPRTIGA